MKTYLKPNIKKGFHKVMEIFFFLLFSPFFVTFCYSFQKKLCLCISDLGVKRLSWALRRTPTD